ncbi:AraC family transcriptional regulator [Aliikangiella sp. G2MR2-5]|uniref:helix-turn-helix domain-containing protein n=1 Tax=Aliikangiella sp. G2MR2-5 TaxID=2788943 RepID=UPI0018AA036C|nr:helix-turn-helix transcriptional regulator [Aliikangiella sp. G2MR2-5]
MSEFSFTLANIVQTLFIFLGILGGALLFEKQRFKGVVLLLAYFTLLMTFNLLEERDISKQFLFITPSFTLLMGPILYFMVMSLASAPGLSHWNWLKHCIPALLSIPFTSHLQWVVALGSISQLMYLVASYRLLQRYDLAVFNSRSDAEALQLGWVTSASIVIIGFLVVDMVRLNIRPLLDNDVYYSWYLVDLNILFLICCYLLVKSVKQPELFDGLTDYESSEGEKDFAKKVAKKAAEGEQKLLAMQLFEVIDKKITSNQLYKTPKLTVQQVAEEACVAVKETSWAINQVSGRNFNDYINGLRIEAVKQQLKAEAGTGPSILDIAMECGFNSKSTFNLAFKKLENMTPTQYAKNGN